MLKCATSGVDYYILDNALSQDAGARTAAADGPAERIVHGGLIATIPNPGEANSSKFQRPCH